MKQIKTLLIAAIFIFVLRKQLMHKQNSSRWSEIMAKCQQC
jgi:hypothetical protein